MNLQRTYLRKAIAHILTADSELQPWLKGRVFANRADPWLVEELPALGVYLLSEEPLETTQAPPENRRQAELLIEIITHYDQTADDLIDKIQALIERAMLIDAIGAAMIALGTTDTLEEIAPPSFTMELLETDGAVSAAGILVYPITYIQPDLAARPAIGNFERMDTEIISPEGEIDGHIDLPGPFPDLGDQ
jgi:hypothetical protein